MKNQKEEVAHMLWLYWDDLPQPKPPYTNWYYGWRKDCVERLFTESEDMP